MPTQVSPYIKRNVAHPSLLKNLVSYRETNISTLRYKDINRHKNWENPKIERKRLTINLEISEEFSLHIKSRFLNLIHAIKKSLFILSYEDNWDDEGSIKYDASTLYSSCKFLIDYFDWIWSEYRLIPAAPNIYPGPSGSIDVLWKNDTYDLLINFPAYPSNVVTFYGDDKKAGKISGQFDSSNPPMGVFIFLHSNQ